MKYTVITITLFFAISAASQNFNYPKTDEKSVTYENTEFHDIVKVDGQQKFKTKAKNIILLIGDGMGTSQLYAGYTANKGKLNVLQMPYTGFSHTQSADNYITDSAAGGTALSTGTRTNNGVIGMDSSLQVLKTILEIGEEHGKATGLVSTSSITHATPASFIAHQPSRNMEEEIATDFLKTDIDVFIGGGKKFFAQRSDSANLLDSLRSKNYQVAEDIDAIGQATGPKLAGFIADGHGAQMPSRGEALGLSTSKAIEILSKSKEGFFLMVEGSQIDWGGHANNTSYVTREMLDFDKAVGLALRFAIKDKNTLVIVTADHETGGMALNGGSIKNGVVTGGFTVTHHTAVMVPVFAMGPKANLFTGVYHNTHVFDNMMEAWGLKKPKYANLTR